MSNDISHMMRFKDPVHFMSMQEEMRLLQAERDFLLMTLTAFKVDVERMPERLRREWERIKHHYSPENFYGLDPEDFDSMGRLRR